MTKIRSSCIAFIAVMIASLAVVQTAGATGRVLLQGGCPAGCAMGKCIEDKTTGKFKCTRCVNNLIVQDGKCACRAGRFTEISTDTNKAADTSNTRYVCTMCPKGSWCPGTLITAAATAQKVDCTQPGLTTTIRGARTKWACVEKPGYGYVVASGEPSAEVCSGDTYNAGYSKKRCQTCPTGFGIDDPNKLTTPDLTKHDNVTDCKVPPGYYQRSPSEVAPCPQGEYSDSYNRASKCQACPVGVTTVKGKINVHAQYCNTLKAGFFAYSGVEVATETGTGHNFYISADALPCPQGFWCPGGRPSEEYTEKSADTDMTTIFKCEKAGYGAAAGTADGPLWTKGQGAKSKDECLLPPGHGLVGSRVVKCASGTYREGWVQPSNPAAACQPCADEDTDSVMSSEASESLTVFPNLNNADQDTPLLVVGSSGSCQMKAGYGMYQTAVGIRVAACNRDSYGSPNVTYGRGINPCRQCPTNMITPSVGIAGADTSIKNDDSTGYTSPLACVTKPGWGWDGRVSTQCPVGSYNEGNNQQECTQCPFGFSTEDDEDLQTTINDCQVAPGYQLNADNNPDTIEECPLGTYIDELHSISTPCTSCGNNRWTFDTGADKAEDCEACAPGYGKLSTAGLTDPCTDCATVAGYGPATRENTECMSCATQSTGFTFIYNGNMEQFLADPVIKSAQASSAGCLSSFAQIESGLWYLSGANTPNTAADVDACADTCGNDCMFFTYDYDAEPDQRCRIMMYTPPATGEEVLAFKAVPAGDVMGPQAKAVASGLYVQWLVESDMPGIGQTETPTSPPNTKGACMAACDMDAKCAAVRLGGATVEGGPSQAISSCKFVYGESDPSTLAAHGNLGKRSLSHVVVSRLT